eukprot:GFUD01020043.1.p1 GENE.GFUD01020043.1~~GFUD01020043.1.p1  ORF type:complete len:402 (+),score=163.91 GFUD01020043.1:39-1208(+)
MGGGRCLLTVLLILPLSTPNILLLHTPNNLENLVDVEVETAADSDADVIEQDGFEILGGFGYSNSLADFEFPVVYKDIVNMEVVDVIDDNLNPSVDMKHILSEQNLVAVKSEELATEILEKVEIETAASETENDEESDKNMDEVVDLFKDKNKEENFEFVKDAEENTDEENHLEDVPNETEIKDTEVDDDEESAVVEEYVTKESDKNMEEVVDLFKDKNKEEDFEFVKDAEENTDEENHVLSETEIKDTETDDDVKDEESAVVEEYVTKIANLPEDVSTEIMSESEPVSQKSDIEFMNEKQREEKVIIIHAGNYEEEDFNNFNPKMTVLASSTDHRIEEEAKNMEMNDNLNITQEEDEMKTLQAISCAEAFKEQIIIVTIFIRCIVMRI